MSLTSCGSKRREGLRESTVKGSSRGAMAANSFRKLLPSGLIVSSDGRALRIGCQTRTSDSTDLTVNSVAARRRNTGILRLVCQNEARTIP